MRQALLSGAPLSRSLPADPPDPLRHLSPASRREFTAFGFGQARPLPHELLHHAVEECVRRAPDSVAVEDVCGSRLSYRELDRQSDALAYRLRAAGVAAGDRVGVFTSRGLEWVVSMLAVLKARAAWVPQDARIAARPMLEQIVATARLEVVLTHSDHVGAVTGLANDVWPVDRLPLDEAVPDRPRALASVDGGDATAVVIFTSGTTGVPNGVEVTHANLVNTLLVGSASLGIEPGMRVAQLLNIAFDMSVWEVFGALTHGATLLVRGADLQETASRADVLIATPSVLQKLDPEHSRQVRIVAVAGERCPDELARTWSAFAAFHNSCGPTEVTIVNTVHRWTPGEELTIGSPLPNTTVYVLDDELRPVETGEIGEMWAGGACVTAGYLGNPRLTAERYRPDPFNGGLMFRCRDLVSWTADGRLRHHGRTDDQVKVHGFRVELDAVTTAIERCPAVRSASTILHEGALVSFVVPVARLDACGEEALPAAARASVADRLPYYYLPEEVHVVAELPVTARGKVDKRALAALLEDAALARHGDVPSPDVPEPAAPAPAAAADLSAGLLRHRELELPPLTAAWRRIWKRRRFMHYNRLAVLVLAANAVVAAWWLGSGTLDSARVSTAVVANFALTALIRQQRVINALFAAATSAPTRWPLRVRWTLGKVYHFGGLHIGGAVATTIWFAVGTWLAISGGTGSGVVLVLSAIIGVLLLVMVLTALPPFRAQHHDVFEKVHRFGGWTALLLFGAQSVVVAAGGAGAIAADLVLSPVLWVFSLVVLSVSATWWDLRRVRVDWERPSDHVAIARFSHRTTFAGSSTAVSRSPLREWHHFANVHTPGEDGFRLTISRAGDWTGRLIDDLPDTVWVKGIPTAGVGNIDKLFRRVLWVATGSGIGPSLPHLLSGDVPARLVWSTRAPERTYGSELVSELRSVQPDAVIWDTTALGKPDLVRLAFAAHAESDVEAVICISNKPTTWSIVEAFEERGIPAYGAIWDS